VGTTPVDPRVARSVLSTNRTGLGRFAHWGHGRSHRRGQRARAPRRGRTPLRAHARPRLKVRTARPRPSRVTTRHCPPPERIRRGASREGRPHLGKVHGLRCGRVSLNGRSFPDGRVEERVGDRRVVDPRRTRPMEHRIPHLCDEFLEIAPPIIGAGGVVVIARRWSHDAVYRAHHGGGPHILERCK
jgi:hypothetical protein